MRIDKITLGILLLLCLLLSACSSDNQPPDPTGQDPDPDPIEEPDPIVIPSTNTLGVVAYAPEVQEGYTLFTISKDTYLINNCGQVIHQWTSDYPPGNAVYLLEDGSILRAGKIDNPDVPYGGLGGIVERIDWDNNVAWAYEYTSASFSQHHDIFPLPNGNVLLLAATKKTEAEAIQAGRDPSKITDGTLYNEQVVEIQPNGAQDGIIVWEWNVWDHLIQDFDDTKDNFGSVSDNPNLLDINYLDLPDNTDADWLHINSVQYNENLDQVLLSVNGINEIHIIDHSTTTAEAATGIGGNQGKGGDILYRWGNPEAYMQGTSTDRQFFGQHYPHWIPQSHPDGGKIILFNNGLGRTTNFSSVDIIDPPTETPGDYVLTPEGIYGPSTAEWTYVDPVDPANFYSRILAGAQRLSNGNTLICEGLLGHVFEIDSENNIVWSYINPETTLGEIQTQGSEPESNRLFRAFKYARNYPAFSGRDLTPGDPIETDFDIGNCE